MPERKPIGLSVPYRKVTPSHTRKEIIEMAQTLSHGWWLDDQKLEAFAKLVIERHHAKTKQVQTKKESA
jgi:hypothetical protein